MGCLEKRTRCKGAFMLIDYCSSRNSPKAFKKMESSLNIWEMFWQEVPPLWTTEGKWLCRKFPFSKWAINGMKALQPGVCGQHVDSHMQVGDRCPYAFLVCNVALQRGKNNIGNKTYNCASASGWSEVDSSPGKERNNSSDKSKLAWCQLCFPAFWQKLFLGHHPKPRTNLLTNYEQNWAVFSWRNCCTHTFGRGYLECFQLDR